MRSKLLLICCLTAAAIGITSCSKNPTDPEPIPDPQADFTWTSQLIAPAGVAFTNASINAIAYNWDFGDGSSSMMENPSHIYNDPATYFVKLVAIGRDTTRTDTVIKQLTILPIPSPQASFIISGGTTTPASIYFQNTSTYADRYQWDFGDGRTSSEHSVRITYSEQGTYTVSLVAILTETQESDTARQRLVIVPGQFFLDSIIVEQIDFNDLTGTPWDDGNGPDIFLNLRDSRTVLKWSSIGNRYDNVTVDSLPFGWDTPDTLRFLDRSESLTLEMFDEDRADADDKMRSFPFRFSDLIDRDGYIRDYILSSGAYRVRLAVFWW